MKYLSKGKRGMVYLTEENGKRVVVKKERKGSGALRALHNEAFWLQELNKHHIGPRFVRFDGEALVMEYIEGTPFVEWYPKQSPHDLRHALEEIFRQCRMMDVVKVNKFEMHMPIKHILMRNKKPVLIDFERCKRTLTPKNVTQFCQFLVHLGFSVDREQLKALLQEYKKTYGEDIFKKIVRFFVASL